LGNGTDDSRTAVTAQSFLKNPSQLTVPVVNECFALGSAAELVDHIAER